MVRARPYTELTMYQALSEVVYIHRLPQSSEQLYPQFTAIVPILQETEAQREEVRYLKQ